LRANIFGKAGEYGSFLKHRVSVYLGKCTIFPQWFPVYSFRSAPESWIRSGCFSGRRFFHAADQVRLLVQKARSKFWVRWCLMSRQSECANGSAAPEPVSVADDKHLKATGDWNHLESADAARLGKIRAVKVSDEIHIS
jgi:hypothetical protein